MSMIHYQLSIDQRHQHLFDVRLAIPAHSSNTLHFSLPAWIPGSYMIRDFAKNIVSITAVDEQGHSLPLQKNDKQSWELHTNGNPVILNYQVYAFDTSIRSAYVDDHRVFFNGTSVFLKIEELDNTPHQLCLIAPADKPQWKVATGLTRSDKTEKYHFGDYHAECYAQLIDCPVEIGSFDVAEFDVYGVRHHLVLSGKHYADMPRICADVEKICQHHIELFEPQSQQAPFTEYWFLTNVLPNGFGGLEHKNSTALLCSTFDLATKSEKGNKTEAYMTFLSLISHEYFHAWNVCRIKPEEFIKPDLGQETYTRQLWAYEGITSYYDDFSLFRCGLINFEQYLKLLQKTLTRVHRGKGQTKQSISDSSFDAWTRFYQQGEDAINNIVSYYTKGSLIALWLDLTLRLHSQGKKSLDDVMRRLWQDHGKTGLGTRDKDLSNVVAELSDHQVAKDLDTLLNQSERLNLSSLLEKFGIQQTQQPAAQDLLSIAGEQQGAYFGVLYRSHAMGLEVTAVLEDSPAESAGIYAKDILLALDELKLDSTSLESLCNTLPPHQPVSMHLFRNQRLVTTEIILLPAPKLIISLSESDPSQSSLWKRKTNATQ
ncbi:M61 family metallopeptidase [Lacimicrobium alkaliphilum]|uniref:Peptidase M61 n=1 Tax=Lacimicrobium alkaliphilum TaxID=1526571 RepID=A0ABQ1R3K0_9ALTE|nr:PDZ domain-containing protein [Lacimicrobium alkaliphilum]GGD53401.1 peptidase M61 [Lacimicrobium alkaliphilum]